VGTYVTRRIVQAALTIFGLSIAVFVVSRLSGDPASLLLSISATPEDINRFREVMGLNEPFYVQYANFLVHALSGNFGTSFQYHEPALQLVLERLPATLLLAATAMAIAALVGVAIGVVSAARRDSWLDVCLSVFVLIGQSTPTFWLGIVLITIFAVHLGLLPSSGYGSLQQLVLPALSLAMYSAASIARLTRASVLEALAQDYIRTARGKGLRERRVIGVHALKNAAIPVVTLMALQFATLLGGAVIVEWIFAWPGIGRLAVQAVFTRDYPLVQAAVFVAALGFVLVNTAVDLLYQSLDPRIRVGAR
jgi:ABC-type dipeptide/oligopeptide/nickel transport system permease component